MGKNLLKLYFYETDAFKQSHLGNLITAVSLVQCILLESGPYNYGSEVSNDPYNCVNEV